MRNHPQVAQILHRGQVDAAFALDRLDQNRDHALVLGGDAAHGLDVVQGDAHESGDQGLESDLHLLVARGGQGREGAPVESLVHHDDRRAFDPLAVAVEPRELDRRLVGFAAGIAEENRVHTADLCELFRRTFLLGNLVEIGGMDQA
jgi:hypothetical protein